MKRRDFVISGVTTGASLLVPALGRSATPCAPSPLAATGGSNVVTSCGASTAESDWVARSTANGVVWAHDFRNAGEVNSFRWVGGYGNDPNSTQPISANVRQILGDGPTGSCLEIIRSAGTQDPASWWRPFSPVTAASNGLGVDDRGANGSLTRRVWSPSNPSQNGQWVHGYYGHADYRSGDTWDGSEFYIQFRAKISSARWASGNQGFDGKLAYIATTGLTPTQELLIQSKADRTYGMYTAFGSPGPLEFLADPQNFTDPNTASRQPGGIHASTCKYPNINPTNCWAYPADQWVTVLVKVTPGHGIANAWGPADNGIEVWVAKSNETSYTKIWDKRNYQIYFTAAKPLGWNAFQASGYFNGQNVASAFSQRYTQIIFSKEFIPCPLV